MEIGRTFEVNGLTYAIKKIAGDRVDASKFKNGNLQRGRPCKFTYKQVAEALGEAVANTAPATQVTNSLEDEYEPIKRIPPDPEKIKALIESFGPEADSTLDDW